MKFNPLEKITTVIKWGGLVYLVIQTLEFFKKGYDELNMPQKPAENESK